VATLPSSPPAGRPPRRPVAVRSAERLSPRFVRVTVGGELSDWPEPGSAAHLKLFLPQAEGETVMRTYTVRAFDRVRGEVAIDVYLHDGNGAAARWAATARPGDGLALSGRSRSTFEPTAGATSYLFGGDASALPAIATCVEALPSSAQATVIVAVADPVDALPLRSPAALDVRWVHEGDDAFADAVGDVETDRAWIACEATLMRRLRGLLLDSRFDRHTLSTRGYWKRGEENHPDHDTGEDT
jgi:NADPH-dependent ferric siderophore reductase